MKCGITYNLNFLSIYIYLFTTQGLIACVSAVLSGSRPAYIYPLPRQKLALLYCKFNYGFVSSCIVNLMIIIACCYFALRARKVPSNYNESKFIGISVYSTLVVCLAAIPVYTTAQGITQKVATLCMALLLNAYLTLICLYFPKLYAIHFAGDNLSIETWRANTGTINANRVHLN